MHAEGQSFMTSRLVMWSESEPAQSLLQDICEGSTIAHGQVPIAIQAAASDSFQRCLVTTQACAAGHSILAVPWPHALTAEGSMQQLRHYDAHGRGLLPGGLESVAKLLEDRNNDLLPETSAWVLLLALHLLCQLRDPRSRWANYVKLLPTPPGTRMSAVCSAGAPATDLLLFSTEELGRLGNPALGLAVSRERLRLMRLHAHLFRLHNAGNAKEPEISQDSFIWAHCLVRSRALDLTADQATGAAFYERCMLPVIDLCNHDGIDATCQLSVRLTPAEVPRAVDVVATRDLEAGAELTLNYGTRPMRDMLRGYGFTPAHAAVTDPSEVYEEIGEACETLIVQGSGRGNLFQLREIKVVGSPGANPLLDLAGQATMCYVVQDEAVSNAGDWHEAPKLSLESSDVSQTSRAASEGDMQDEASFPSGGFGGRSAPALPPEDEHACVLRLSGLCRELLELLPSRCTSRSAVRPGACTPADSSSCCAKDHPVPPHSPPRRECVGSAAAPGCPLGGFDGCNGSGVTEAGPCKGQVLRVEGVPGHQVDCKRQSPAPASQDSWRSRTHRHMAAGYCMQRKLLLQRVAADLECQAWLLSGRLANPAGHTTC